MISLCRELDEHPGAFAYDWRTRFGVPSTVIGQSMDWAEAYWLTRELLTESDSHVAVALNGWQYPWRSESFLLADLFDVYVQRNSKRAQPRPRPTDKPTREQSRRPTISARRVLAELAKRGHHRTPREGDAHG